MECGARSTELVLNDGDEIAVILARFISLHSSALMPGDFPLLEADFISAFPNMFIM